MLCFLDWCQGLYDFGKVNLLDIEKPKFESDVFFGVRESRLYDLKIGDLGMFKMKVFSKETGGL